jgi:hypothetical protein
MMARGKETCHPHTHPNNNIPSFSSTCELQHVNVVPIKIIKYKSNMHLKYLKPCQILPCKEGSFHKNIWIFCGRLQNNPPKTNLVLPSYNLQEMNEW